MQISVMQTDQFTGKVAKVRKKCAASPPEKIVSITKAPHLRMELTNVLFVDNLSGYRPRHKKL